MSRLLEHHGKKLLGRAGVSVPTHEVASNAVEAEEAAAHIDDLVALKALVPVGKRMKAGAVQFAETPKEARKVADSIFGTEVYGYPVEQLLIEEQIPIEKELFVSFTLDTESEQPVAVLSSEGGIEVEDEGTGETITKTPIDFEADIHEYRFRNALQQLGLEREPLVSAAQETTKLARLFVDKDLTTLEVNPLVITPQNDTIAVAAVVKPDSAASFRHSKLIENAYPGSDRLWRPPNERELEMYDINEEKEGGDITYMEFDGNVGMVMYSGGMSLMTIDMLLQRDIAPANYSDINPPPSYKKTYRLTELVIERDEIEALLGTGNIANLSRVDIRVEAIVDALQNNHVDLTDFPVVIRMAGEGQEQAREVTDSVPGVHYFADEKTVTEAVEVFADLLSEQGLRKDSVQVGEIV